MIWKRASASQGKAFLRCQSRWHWEKIGGFRGEETGAMRLGKRVHALLELYLRGERLPQDKEALAIALPGMKYLPKPKSFLGAVEDRIYSTTLGCVPILGFVDLYYWQGDCLVIVDHKSTGNLQYALAPSEISRDFQAMIYACWASLRWPDERITFRLVYYTSRPPYRSRVSEYAFSDTDIEAAKTYIRQTLDRMLLASITDIASVPYNLAACHDYKSAENPMGCPHRERCAELGRQTMGAASSFFQLGKLLEGKSC